MMIAAILANARWYDISFDDIVEFSADYFDSWPIVMGVIGGIVFLYYIKPQRR